MTTSGTDIPLLPAAVSGKIKNMLEKKSFIYVAFLALLITFSYSFSILDDPRMSDGMLEWKEAKVFEIIIIMLAPISIISTWFLAIIHSFKSGKKTWGLFTIIFWPVAFIYAIKIVFFSHNKNSV